MTKSRITETCWDSRCRLHILIKIFAVYIFRGWWLKVACLTNSVVFRTCDNYLVLSIMETPLKISFVVVLIVFVLCEVHWVLRQYCWTYRTSMWIKPGALSHGRTQVIRWKPIKARLHPEPYKSRDVQVLLTLPVKVDLKANVKIVNATQTAQESTSCFRTPRLRFMVRRPG